MHHAIDLALVCTCLEDAFVYDPDPPFFRVEAGVLAIQWILLVYPLER